MKKMMAIAAMLTAAATGNCSASGLEDLAAGLKEGPAPAAVPAVPAAELPEVLEIGEGDVIITVDRFTAPNEAPLVFALCDSERCHQLQDKGYKDIKAELLESSPASRKYLVRGLKPGEYSISGYNDMNGNGRLDTGLFGIPKEPVGFSVLNAAKLGANPAWDSVKFAVDSAPASVYFHLIHKFGL